MASGGRWFCRALPGYDERDILGKFIVFEGGDEGARAELASSLRASLHESGWPVKDSIPGSRGVLSEQLGGLSASFLGSKAAALARATIITEELEGIILPALQANFTVIAHSYIYSCLTDSIITGVDEEWLQNLYSRCLVPDLAFYLDIPPEVLVERQLLRQTQETRLNFAEGEALYDLLLCREQIRRSHLKQLADHHGFITLDGTRDIEWLGGEVVKIATRLFYPAS